MLLTALVMLGCCCAFSQSGFSLRGKKLKEASEQMRQWQNLYPQSSSSAPGVLISDTARKPSTPIDQMPVVRLDRRKPQYLFNNGKGMDVYAAATDNMPILRPDANFNSSMPVKK